MNRRIHAALAAAVLFVAGISTGAAQTTRSFVDGYEDALKSKQTITALGPDVFGENVNLQDGAT